MVKFGNLKRNYLSIKDEINEAVMRVLEKGWFVLGEEGTKFEEEFSNFCGKEFGVGVNSGTDALKLALKAINIQQGDEVITVPNTAIPTVMAIIEAGAKPVFVDVGEDYLIDVSKIENAITPKTKAIMPVHLYGQVCEMKTILRIAERNNLKVIEDCAQAHGAEYKGKRVPIGNIGCFSFYPSKNLGAYGEGGMIITNEEKVCEKLKLLRNYGQSSRYDAKILGLNSRLDEVQAAILRVKLKHLEGWNEQRRKYAQKYNQNLNEIIKIPKENLFNKHVYHLYVIALKNRKEIMENLKREGIDTGIHYPIPLHLQEAFNYLNYKAGDFPVAEKNSKEILSLPIFPELEESEISEVCEKLNGVLQSYL
ncbi:DegT/DnrJ/EryC1/StrS family aminotransferase [archaeon]|jgi:dTDP-4-amino-4,6-dideoxygalactose transaminase|nr:DegT/DnrJ/EryC1/StrS family aminotransferase [archaeon]MBT4373095.1 DegT/DnrJ/EryC1/StrS family aminotransferase [archaeon]MBT4531440.1 DegT/DnrJ/EryC1/StrS family aminotransferase [archaeon]MBT7001382.1 DegT/DnrJ/EryC1/StrS family aminotransferase [archaeon]MBT7282132.1 DegT/DnrJ/EryC1/StrS family aminotransferase [archaeon]